MGSDIGGGAEYRTPSVSIKLTINYPVHNIEGNLLSIRQRDGYHGGEYDRSRDNRSIAMSIVSGCHITMDGDWCIGLP